METENNTTSHTAGEGMSTYREWVMENNTIVWTAHNCPIMVQRLEPGHLSSEDARTLIQALNEAVDYSEGINDQQAEDAPKQVTDQQKVQELVAFSLYCWLKAAGVEITDDVAEHAAENLKEMGLLADELKPCKNTHPEGEAKPAREPEQDTPRNLRAIYSTLAECGVCGEEAHNVMAAVRPIMGLNRPYEVMKEAEEQLGLENVASYTDLVHQLADARRRMEEIAYNTAAWGYFGSEGVVFALLAPLIKSRLEYLRLADRTFKGPTGE